MSSIAESPKSQTLTFSPTMARFLMNAGINAHDDYTQPLMKNQRLTDAHIKSVFQSFRQEFPNAEYSYLSMVQYLPDSVNVTVLDFLNAVEAFEKGGYHWDNRNVAQHYSIARAKLQTCSSQNEAVDVAENAVAAPISARAKFFDWYETKGKCSKPVYGIISRPRKLES